MQVIVDNLLITYELKGKGKLVLLLHGWGDSIRGLRELQNKLSVHYQVLAVDLPGMGVSQAPTKAWDLDNYSKFLNALLAKLNLKQPYAVLGHSNGGAIAIRAISLNELQPSKLILLASAGIRNKDEIKKGALKAVAKTGKIATLGLPKSKREKLRKILYKAARSDLLVLPELEETFKKTVGQDVQADAKTINLPTLMVYGDEDTATPVSHGQILNKLISDSRLEVLPAAGHFVHQDVPNKVTNLVEDFLSA